MEGRSITGAPLSTQQRRTVGLPTPHSHCAHRGHGAHTTDFVNFTGTHMEVGLNSELISNTPAAEVAPQCCRNSSNSDFCGCTNQMTGSDSSCRGNTPVPPTSHHRLEVDLGACTPTTGEQTLSPKGL